MYFIEIMIIVLIIIIIIILIIKITRCNRKLVKKKIKLRNPKCDLALVPLYLGPPFTHYLKIDLG